MQDNTKGVSGNSQSSSVSVHRKNSVTNFLKSKPVFLFLLPVFFVLHGFTSNYDSVPVADALLLTAEYILITVAITGIFWLFYRDTIKAALMTFFIFLFYFFFGGLQDFVKSHFHALFILRYRFIIPTALIIFFALLVLLRKTKKPFLPLISYLNILLLALILIDTGWLVTKIPAAARNKRFNPADHGLAICDSCSKPDIFLIIPDQYSGNTALREVFHFDNSTFENELERRGFHISKESRSNYNLTPFSVASTLNMDYLELHKGRQNYATVNYSYKVIRNGGVLKFLESMGYQFHNCSIFDFDKQPAYKYKAFLPYGIKLITSQTFIGRLQEDFESDILDGRFGSALQKKLAYENLHFNDEIIDLTAKISGRRSQQPKFVYTHLMMPHYPYYYDSKSVPLPLEKLTHQNKSNSNDYIEYLQYSNKKILGLIDQILASSPSAIIMLLSDHGFQNRENNFNRKYDFMNLNAAYLPGRNNTGLYDSITNVNQFRVFFNTYFNQHLPLLKDSTINVWD